MSGIERAGTQRVSRVVRGGSARAARSYSVSPRGLRSKR